MGGYWDEHIWTSQPQLCGPHSGRLTNKTRVIVNHWLTKVDDVVNHVILIVVVLCLFSMHGKKETRHLQEGKSKKITHVCSFDFFTQQDINASFTCASCISKRMVENVCLIVIQIEKLSRIVSISGSGTEKLFFPFVPCLKRSRDCKSYLTHCRPDSIQDQIWKWNVHSSLSLCLKCSVAPLFHVSFDIIPLCINNPAVCSDKYKPSVTVNTLQPSKLYKLLCGWPLSGASQGTQPRNPDQSHLSYLQYVEAPTPTFPLLPGLLD